MRKLKTLAVLSLLLCLVGCSVLHSSAPRTPETVYFATVRQFNDTVADYLTRYEAADPATQEELKRTINPIIKKASKALDLWWLALSINDPGTNQQQAFLELRNQLLTLLIEHGLLEVNNGTDES